MKNDLPTISAGKSSTSDYYFPLLKAGNIKCNATSQQSACITKNILICRQNKEGHRKRLPYAFGPVAFIIPCYGKSTIYFLLLYMPIPIFRPAEVPYLKSFKPKSAYKAGSMLTLSLI